MNVKRIISYAIYYGIFFILTCIIAIKLLDYFGGYNWKSIVVINILGLFLILPAHIQIKKTIDKHLPKV